ncbi:MAG TPA: MmgE/PrpD family protein, partial [Burkholderiales bacterium]|nr:MmgE/PrpD family protein [Burkholderiales bacterium]
MKAETLPAGALARQLVDFLQRLEVGAVPSAVGDIAKWCLLDALGCVLFGSQQEWSRIMREEMAAEGARGNSTVVGSAQPFAAPAAALCNGTA